MLARLNFGLPLSGSRPAPAPRFGGVCTSKGGPKQTRLTDACTPAVTVDTKPEELLLYQVLYFSPVMSLMKPPEDRPPRTVDTK